MRLVCPNCGAQYEVDDRVVPEGGRDVQCSACGHGWYQMPAGHGQDEAVGEPPVDEQLTEAEPDEDLTETVEEAEDKGASDEAEDADEPQDDAEPEPAAEDEADEYEPQDDEAEDLPSAVIGAQPREIDEGIKSILQEEAQREMDARATETTHEPEPVETQPDLGLDAGPSPDEERRRIARERMARMRGLDDDDVAEPDFDANAEPSDEANQSAPGRSVFPDIEEINSTLDSHAPGSEARIDSADLPAARRSGFGRGFMLVIFVAVLLFALYTLAPNLSERVPALEPYLTAYVDAVNAARLWLDTNLRVLIEKIEAAAGA